MILRNREQLGQIAMARLDSSGDHAKRFVDSSCEVVVFGSMAAGLERPDSDIDILCIGGAFDFKAKTESLDLIVVPVTATRNSLWLGSELASHIMEYGIWLKGSPHWGEKVHIGQKAIDEKRRRIGAYMKSLPSSWLQLDDVFRAKYSVKLRRETQRLLLLETGAPVPPTRILDDAWGDISRCSYEVRHRLNELASQSSNIFMQDLFARIDSHFGTPGRH